MNHVPKSTHQAHSRRPRPWSMFQAVSNVQGHNFALNFSPSSSSSSSAEAKALRGDAPSNGLIPAWWKVGIWRSFGSPVREVFRSKTSPRGSRPPLPPLSKQEKFPLVEEGGIGRAGVGRRAGPLLPFGELFLRKFASAVSPSASAGFFFLLPSPAVPERWRKRMGFIFSPPGFALSVAPSRNWKGPIVRR